MIVFHTLYLAIIVVRCYFEHILVGNMLEILFLFYLLAHTKLVNMDLIKSSQVFIYFVLTFAPTS